MDQNQQEIDKIDRTEFEELFSFFTKAEFMRLKAMKYKEFWNFIHSHSDPRVQDWIQKRFERIIDKVAHKWDENNDLRSMANTMSRK